MTKKKLDRGGISKKVLNLRRKIKIQKNKEKDILKNLKCLLALKKHQEKDINRILNYFQIFNKDGKMNKILLFTKI